MTHPCGADAGMPRYTLVVRLYPCGCSQAEVLDTLSQGNRLGVAHRRWYRGGRWSATVVATAAARLLREHLGGDCPESEHRKDLAGHSSHAPVVDAGQELRRPPAQVPGQLSLPGIVVDRP